VNAPSQQTVDEESHESHDQARRGRAGRRAMVAVIAVFVVIGIAGWWGPRQATATHTSGQVRLEVSYPRITRGGLPGEWRVIVTRPDRTSLGGQLVMSNPLRYLATFDQHGVDPTPAESWVSGDRLFWQFDVPDDVVRFEVSLDGRVQPGVNWRRSGETTVTLTGDAASVAYATWVMP